MKYWNSIQKGTLSVLKGLYLTFKHLRKGGKSIAPVGIEDKNYFQLNATGSITIEYPKFEIPVPDHGRYKLHLEEDDCIVCDQCARICPVDCITMEGIKAPGEIGKTSDGTKKRIYLPVFTIDMAKCCYCGLCTIVCPTECLTMTNKYDFPTLDRNEFLFEFANMSAEEVELRKAELAQFETEKKAAKEAALKLKDNTP